VSLSVAQMEIRRRYVAGSKARRKPRAFTPSPPPRAAVTDYVSVLTKLSDEMDAEIIDVIVEVTGIPRAMFRVDAAADGAVPPPLLPSQIRRILDTIERTLRELTGRRSLVGEIDRIALRTQHYADDQWRLQLQRVFGVPRESFPGMELQLAAFRRENVALIRRLAEDKAERVRSVLEQSVGRRHEEIAGDIARQMGATQSRAALIARDQVLKCNGQVTRTRHGEAGITEYEWSTSRDERVRPDHAALDGKVFRYADPPITDERTGRRCNPGEDIQCRCVAIPRIPGVDS